MVLTSPQHSSASGDGTPKRLSLGFLVSLMAICAKHASRVSNKLKTANKPSHYHHDHLRQEFIGSPKSSPRSPLLRPKRLLSQLSNKAITLVHGGNEKKKLSGAEESDEFGDGGVWQRAILMGDKCQPLDFSGVIYYDSEGKQLNELPLRSPRASPLPGYLTRKVGI